MNLLATILMLLISSKILRTSHASTDANAKTPYETQRAQCTINAGEIQASAEASISKTLEGVCGSDEMKMAFTKLEEKLLLELQVIKEMMEHVLVYKNGEISGLKVASSVDLNLKASQPTVSPTPQTVFSTMDKPAFHNINKPFQQLKEIKKTEFNGAVNNNQLARTNPTVILRNRKHETLLGKVEDAKPNKALLSGVETKRFAYYWKLDKFMQKLKTNISVDYSPTFSISGKRLRLKAFFNHLNRDFLYLQLDEHLINIQEQYKSVFLETSSMFQPLHSKFLPKYKIAILHQIATSSQDLESQEFTNNDSGFLIPNSALLSNSFIKNDTILIKLIVYL